MRLITFVVAAEGHYVTDGKEYDKSIRFEDGKELSELREITDEEFYELFPEERPEETEPETEAADGGEVPEAVEPPEEETETE